MSDISPDVVVVVVVNYPGRGMFYDKYLVLTHPLEEFTLSRPHKTKKL